MANPNNSNVLDFQDPGTLPNELLDMPGFVNELTDYTLSESHSPKAMLHEAQFHVAEGKFDALVKRFSDSSPNMADHSIVADSFAVCTSTI